VLHHFLSLNRTEIIARSRMKAGLRMLHRHSEAQWLLGVPVFLEQLTQALRREQEGPVDAEAAPPAVVQGGELRRAGFTVAQVVHDYGDTCHAVTELAMEAHIAITTRELEVLNRCLDEAISEAVTESTRQRDVAATEAERRGVFAHELSGLLGTAVLSFEALQTGAIGVGGSTGALLGRNLLAARDLVERTLGAPGQERRRRRPLSPPHA
jgi:hypothetical protein